MSRLIHCLKLTGTFEQVKGIVNSGHDVNCTDEGGKTALHWCANYCWDDHAGICIKIIRFLVNQGADVNAKDRKGQTPLMMFLHKKCGTALIETLLDCGADVTCRNLNGQTALHYYSKIKDKSVDVFRRLTERFPNIDVRDKDNKTPLMYFLVHGSELEYIQLLLDAGSDVTYRTRTRNTVLHYYAKWSNEVFYDGNKLDILKRLIGDWSLLDSKNSDGVTPVMMFVAYQLPLKEVQFLLDGGADVNASNEEGNSVLHFAFAYLSRPYVKVIQTLLEYGANPNNGNVQGQTLLWVALSAGHDYYIMLLYNYGLSRNHGHIFIGTYIKYYGTLTRVHQIVFKHMLLESETALDCYVTDNLPHYYHFRWFVDSLIEEVKKMKRRIVVGEMTLFEFVAEPERRKYVLYLNKCSINCKMLKIEFPHYTDIVMSKIQFSNRLLHFIYDRIQCVSIASKAESDETSNEVELDVDCFRCILRYVTDRDMKNLILASLHV